MPKLTDILLTVLLILMAVIGYEQYRVVENQKAQMKQQFHSDGIALVALFGDDGLSRLQSAIEPRDLSYKHSFATGLLLQRFVVAYWIRNAFTDQEWREMVIKDGQYVMRSPLLRLRWNQVREWYPKEICNFFEKELLQK